MTKTGIWAIIVAIAFIAGTLMTNPFAEAAGGWKEALESLTVDWSQLTGIPDDIADGDDTIDDDNDPTNEIQDLSFDPDTNSLSISQGNSVFLPEVGDEVLIDSCPADHSIRVINEDGTVECEEDTDTKYSAAAPLTLSGTTFGLSSSGCLDGQVLKWNGGTMTWNCAPDIDTNTDTVYTDADAISAVEGATLSSVRTSGDYNYDSPQTRKITLGASDFSGPADIKSSHLRFANAYVPSTSTFQFMHAPIHTIPDGAIITGLSCKVEDSSATYDVTCDLSKNSGTGIVTSLAEARVSSSGATAGIQTISTNPISWLVDRDTGSYRVGFFPSDVACDSACKIYTATITYTVSKAD